MIAVPDDRREEAVVHVLDAFPDGYEETPEGYAGVRPTDQPAPTLPAWMTLAAEPVAPGWRDGWRAFHRPVAIAGTWVRPAWLEEPADAVVLEPGYAFGTGSHPTTRGVGTMLADEPPGSLLDLGCGSGLLSILAVAWGHGPVTAWDLDPHAVEATRANVARNGMEARIDVRHADVLVEPLPSVDLALANIEGGVVERLLRRDGLPQRVIVSGLRAEHALDHGGWTIERDAVEDGWRTLLLSRR